MKILARTRLKDGTVWFEAYETSNVYVLHWKKAAKATLTKTGKILSVQKQPEAKPVSLRIVHNMILAYARSLRGVESLHATVLERNGKAFALCAPSGTGKSTTAAEFLFSDTGWNLITDDVAYLKIINKRAYVHRNPCPVLKLSKKTLRYFKHQKALQDSFTYDTHLEKYILLTQKQIRAANTVPLNGIFILQRRAGGKKVAAKKLKGAKAALHLYANLYNEILRPRRVQKKQFYQCAEIAKHVPVVEVFYPSGWKHLRRVEKIILEGSWRY